MPRFYAENFAQNRSLLKNFIELANATVCTPAQLALAWLLAKSPDIIPIPGTTSLDHLRENSASVGVRLNSATLAAADRIINHSTVFGARYNEATQQEIDTEMFE
jgi:aryl-alcohol dehydrogenase-like predicted oxidoreductase